MRKADGLKVKERGVKRSLQTSLGEVEYRRTYYETAEGEHVYLLDHLIGVEPYERVSKALCAKLVNLSAEMSYGKSVRHGNAEVSRQTVSNKVSGKETKSKTSAKEKVVKNATSAATRTVTRELTRDILGNLIK